MMKYKPGTKPRAADSAREAWRQHRMAVVTQQKELGKALGISQPAISKWRHVPARRVEAVALFMGLRPEDLRPDLAAPDPWSALVPNRKD